MKNLYDHINQSGITYGEKKLELMREACRLQAVPLSDGVHEEGNIPTLFVKLFDPSEANVLSVPILDVPSPTPARVEEFYK